jgi:molecular chaperone GrpE
MSDNKKKAPKKDASGLETDLDLESAILNDETNPEDLLQEALEAAEQEAGSPEDPTSEATNADQDDPAALKDQLLRALAELENTRRRAEREKQDMAKYGITNFARDMVTVLDNFQRALATVPEGAIQENETLKHLVSGIEMTDQQFLQTLERHGVKHVAPKVGDKFDHNFHQAMMEVDTQDQPPGHIVHVMQSGYVLHDRLLRPAMVSVAKVSGGEKPKSADMTV